MIYRGVNGLCRTMQAQIKQVITQYRTRHSIEILHFSDHTRICRPRDLRHPHCLCALAGEQESSLLRDHNASNEFTHTLTYSLTHTHAYSHAYSHTHSLTHSLPLSLPDSPGMIAPDAASSPALPLALLLALQVATLSTFSHNHTTVTRQRETQSSRSQWWFDDGDGVQLL